MIELGADVVSWQGYDVAPARTWYFRPHLATVPLEYLRAMVSVEEHRQHFADLNVRVCETQFSILEHLVDVRPC